MNVIVVQWKDLASWSHSAVSTGNSLYVAMAIHFVIKKLMDIMDVNEKEVERFLNRMLVIGHGMGAHVGGKLGDLLADDTGPIEVKLGTLIAIDASGPGYTPYGTKHHCLTYKNARRVLALHTGDVFLGNNHLLGHEDWFAKGGKRSVPSSPVLSHFRGGNMMRAFVWGRVSGRLCKKPNHYYRGDDLTNAEYVEAIEFDLAKIPNMQSEYTKRNHPIYLPFNSKEPYFNDDTPSTIPAYTKTTTHGRNRITFKYFNRHF